MKLSIFYISLLSLSLSANSTDISDIKDSLTSAGEVDLFSKQLSPSLLKSSKVKTAELSEKLSVSQAVEALNTEITPVCPTLSTDVLYTLTAANAGDVACYHFELTEKSKTTALLVNQEVGNNVDLSILQHNIDDTFTLIGSSNNTDNTDEVVYMLSEPGHYYWYMSVIETTGAPFNFGAAVVTDLDNYEFNDTVATSTILSDKQHHITGNMDSASDIDYFQFTAVRGQDVIIGLDDNQLDEWILEIYSNGWIELALGEDIYTNLKGLQENQSINVRVRPNPNLAVNPVNDYNLLIGTKVTSMTKHSVGGELNLETVPFSSFYIEEIKEDPITGEYITVRRAIPFPADQAFRILTWTVTLQDSTGHPVQGAKVNFRFDPIVDVLNGDTINYTDYIQTTDGFGNASGSINLGSCSAQVNLSHKDRYGYEWRTRLTYSAWRIEVPDAADLSSELGVGGDNVPYVLLGHICDQR